MECFDGNDDEKFVQLKFWPEVIQHSALAVIFVKTIGKITGPIP